jgi:hypothetical protein
VFISGFTFVRNAIKYDYPVVESINSILPICDEFIVAVGRSDDGTRELIEGIDSDTIRIIDTVWDPSLKKGGEVLAVETNKALDAISPEATWAFYLQADEVIHEDSILDIRVAMERWKGWPDVEGLLFDYTHFYGSYDYVGDSRRWYRNEVRIIRNDPAIRSYRDAQGFRKNGKPLNVRPANASVLHYGWVKPPATQQAKLESFHKLWHNEDWIGKNLPMLEEFDYSNIDSLSRFTGTHPEVMLERIARKNWEFNFDPTQKNFSTKTKFLHWVERKTGWRPGEYRNYKLIS